MRKNIGRNLKVFVILTVPSLIFYFVIFTETSQNNVSNKEIRFQTNDKDQIQTKDKDIKQLLTLSKHNKMHQHCEPIYGKIAIVTVSSDESYRKNKINNDWISKTCYAKLKRYDSILIEFQNGTYKSGLKDPSILNKCPNDVLMNIRHCIVAHLLDDYDYIVHMDGDTGVINPNHCLEEYIKPGYDIFLQERIHSGELCACHYIVKNTKYAKEMLLNWSKKSKRHIDNEVLLEIVYSMIMKKSEYRNCSRRKYWPWQKCLKNILKGQKIFDHIYIYRRGQAFARDGWVSGYYWSETDFFIHAMKRQDDVYFNRQLSENDCSEYSWNLPVEESLYVDVQTMKAIWKDIDEKILSKNEFSVTEHDKIEQCWPHCE